MVRNSEIQFKMHGIYEKMRNKHLARLIDIYSKKIHRTQHLALQKWKTVTIMPKIISQAEIQHKQEQDHL